MADPDTLQPTNDNNEAVDFGKKKKKKKTKEDLLKEDEPQAATPAPKSTNEDKENKPQAEGGSAADAAGDAATANPDDIELDLNKMKKKKKGTVVFDDEKTEVIEFQDATVDPTKK